MTVIRVPRPPAEAQDKDRRLSDLLKAQIEHFRHVEEKYISNIKTEGQAANYIRHVTRLLHPEGAAAEAEATKNRAKPSLLKPVAATASQPQAPAIVVDRIAAQADETATVPVPSPKPPAAKGSNRTGTAQKKPGKAR